MKSWAERPVEIAHLLNPAFCGEILRRCVQKYSETCGESFPFALAFLVLAIVLHKNTRDSMASSRKQMHTWLAEHPTAKIGFAARVNDLLPITKEAVMFLLQAGVLQIDDQGCIATVNSRKRGRSRHKSTQEIDDCFKKSETIGSWFARSGSPATIYTMWGVKP